MTIWNVIDPGPRYEIEVRVTEAIGMEALVARYGNRQQAILRAQEYADWRWRHLYALGDRTAPKTFKLVYPTESGGPDNDDLWHAADRHY